MITRRGFFSFLASLPFIGAIFAKQEILERTPPDLDASGGSWDTLQQYRGYKIKFTGWKQCQNTDTEAAQWVGYPIPPEPIPVDVGPQFFDDAFPYLVAPCPGLPEAFRRGANFDIKPRRGETEIVWLDGEKFKDKSKKKSGRRLIRMIDAVMDSGKRGLKINEWNELLQSKGIIPPPQTEEEANADVRRPMQGLRIRSRILV